MKSRRIWWLTYGLCVAAGAGALILISVVVLRLEAENRRADAMRDEQESLRLALWRLDSWLAPRLARETARPYFEYASYYPQEQAYTKLLTSIKPREVLTPSPLLTFESDLILLHFQRSAEGVLSSPQVPTGNQRDLAEATGALDGARIEAGATRLVELSRWLSDDEFEQKWRAADQWFASLYRYDSSLALVPAPAIPDLEQQIAMLPQSQISRNRSESGRRGQVSKSGQEVLLQEQMDNYALNADSQADEVVIGAFIPIWLNKGEAADNPPLLYVRRLRTGDVDSWQGMLINWPHLREQLRNEIADLFPRARLEPVRTLHPDDELAGRTLATAPLSLEYESQAIVPSAGLSPTRLALGLMWVALSVVVFAVGFTLRSSISFGERRSRFASVVSHELRTPLTTFRLYSDLLASGKVKEEEQRQEYFTILKSESGRLAALVENVLAYARLEEGRTALQRSMTSVGELIERQRPQLIRRAEEASMELRIDVPDEADAMKLETDGDAVGQILLNLVDNACKYARSGDDRRINLTVGLTGDQVRFTVRDYGPGIDSAFARELFVAYRRDDHSFQEAVPGVGLGLTLSRGLARDLGGDLMLDRQDDPADSSGACFSLTLPKHG